MDVHPVVVPIESLWIPREKLSFVFANAFEQGPHVVRAKDVGVFNGEGKKHFKSFLRFAGLFFDAIDGFLHAIDDAFVFSATPPRLCFVKKCGHFLRCIVHHRKGSRFKTLRRNTERLHARGDFPEEPQPILFLKLLLAPKHSDHTDNPLHVVGI